MSNFIKTFWQEEDGLQTVEIVLIITVVAAVVVIFRNQITTMVTNLLQNAENQVTGAAGP